MMARVAVVLLVVVLLGVGSSADAYFPVYRGEPLHSAVGRFLDFRNGSRGGGVIVQDASGKRVVYRSSYNLMFGGRPTTCYKNPTHDGFPSGCNDWPRALVVGAPVRVSYWIERSPHRLTDRVARDVSPLR